MPRMNAADRERRREKSRDLYLRGLSIEAVAHVLDTSTNTVRQDLLALGIPRRAVGHPRLHAEPDPRACEHCGMLFTPPSAYQVALGNGRFCTRECHYLHRAKYPRPASRACERCGNTFTPEAYQVAKGHGRFCSQSCANGDPPVWVECEQCGRAKRVPPSWAFETRPGRGKRRFCSHRCWGQYRDEHGLMPDASIAMTRSWRYRQKSKGKRALYEAKADNKPGGRKLKSTPEQRELVYGYLDFNAANPEQQRSQRWIALKVFGDVNKRHLVRYLEQVRAADSLDTDEVGENTLRV